MRQDVENIIEIHRVAVLGCRFEPYSGRFRGSGSFWPRCPEVFSLAGLEPEGVWGRSSPRSSG